MIHYICVDDKLKNIIELEMEVGLELPAYVSSFNY